MITSADERLIESALPPGHHRELARRGTVRRYRKGLLLIQEGDVGDTLYVVLEGRLKAFSEDLDGRELVYGLYGPGEIIGEMSLDGGPRSASVCVTEESVCAVVRRDEVRRYINEHPDFAFHLLSLVIARARQATESARRLALLNVYQRLAVLLDSVAVEGEGGVRSVPRLTQQEIAGRIGASREMVSRVLKVLVEGGYIELREREIALLKALPADW